MIRVQIQNNSNSKAIGRREVRTLTGRLARFVLAREAGDVEGEVSVVFVDEEEMRSLNNQYRGLDRPTDVLSFPMEEGDTETCDALNYRVFGDIVICIPVAARYAEKQGHSVRQELSVLLVHGALHLLGYDDEDVNARRRMMRKQKKLLREFQK